MKAERPEPNAFVHGDVVTVDGGPERFHVLAVGNARRDVLVTGDPRSNTGVWVAIEQVRHAEVAK